MRYDLDPRKAKYFIHIPKSYSPSLKFGLLVYISSWETDDQVPEGWAEILDRRHLLYICPQNAGNHCGSYVRSGLALLGALEMMRQYNIDQNRVYIAGISGGAREASHLGFAHPDVFHGTIQTCGTDFYKDVKTRYATTDKDFFGNHYGVLEASPAEVEAARKKQKFVLVTGSGDYRRGNILDIYYGGYAAEKFQCKLFDIMGMGHRDCDPDVLQQALNFIEEDPSSR